MKKGQTVMGCPASVNGEIVVPDNMEEFSAIVAPDELFAGFKMMYPEKNVYLSVPHACENEPEGAIIIVMPGEYTYSPEQKPLWKWDRHLYEQIFDQEWGMADLHEGKHVSKADVRRACEEIIKRYMKEVKP